MLSDIVLDRARETAARSGTSVSGMYARITEGTMTRGVGVSDRCKAWPRYETNALNAARVRGATRDELRQLVAELHEKRKTIGLDQAKAVA